MRAVSVGGASGPCPGLSLVTRDLTLTRRFNSAGVLRSATSELRRLGSCCHKLHSSSVSDSVLPYP